MSNSYNKSTNSETLVYWLKLNQLKGKTKDKIKYFYERSYKTFLLLLRLNSHKIIQPQKKLSGTNL